MNISPPFRKSLYVVCVFVLPLVTALENIFYVETISDIVGSVFTTILFFTVMKKRLRRELKYLKMER